MSRGFLLTVTFLAALGAGLMAGLFFAFSVSVMRALARISPPAGIAAMQAINVVILNPLFGLVFFGTVMASLLLGGYAVVIRDQPGAWYLGAGAACYVIGGFLVTMAFNVPRNNALAALDPSSAGAASAWSRYVSEWTNWNHVRTIGCLASSAAFMMAFAMLRGS
jgi:uncharacterized membrane protein